MALPYSLDDLRAQLQKLSKKQITEQARAEGCEIPGVSRDIAIELLYEFRESKFANNLPASPPALESPLPSSPAGGGRRIEIRLVGQGTDTRWRAGRRWNRTPVQYPADAFTAAEMAELQADPRISIREI